MTGWTKHTLNIWNKIRSSYRLPKNLSPLTNIGLIKTFLPNVLDNGFKKWTEYNLTYQYQLIKDGNIKTFEKLKVEFDLPNIDFLKYLQLRSFLMSHKDWEKILHSNPIEQFLVKQVVNEDKKIIVLVTHYILNKDGKQRPR
ncbi:unnamed protein product [Menidia menidia]|uniref:(Atlantic silverside) hypothetical protein n=1 Tax=Menidia menidia TaxID=238744 RepID=A0A8S4BKX2_9TELE|nr:unnamed protein product [Menidia menidia]